MDGSQKLPQRMLDGIRVHLQRGSRWPLLALGVAGWMRYVSGIDDAGQAIDIRDPLSDKIQALVAGSRNEERVSALLSLEEIFGRDLPRNTQFVENITAAWHQLPSVPARPSPTCPGFNNCSLADRIFLSAVTLSFPLFSSG
jgi:fructuronate reductase